MTEQLQPRGVKTINYFSDFKWDEIKMPIKSDKLEELLNASGYDQGKTDYLINGFRNGFNIEYAGRTDRKEFSDNLPLGDLGDSTDLWNKVMKEVELGRYTGPYELDELPFDHFLQSPLGLIPKAGGKTRLIFHLSFNFKSGEGSLNANTPKEKCSVRYRDLDHEIKNCLKLIQTLGKKHNGVIFFRKSDLQLAFRFVLLNPKQHCWLVMKAKDPSTGKTKFFIEKCLPFGASISCAIFQAFSDALQFLIEHRLKVTNRITNYLNDYIFITLSKIYCDFML